MNHVSFETARKLKEAGWPQDSTFNWFDREPQNHQAPFVKYGGDWVDFGGIVRKVICAAPSTDELIAALENFDLDGWMLKDITPERLAQIWLDSRI